MAPLAANTKRATMRWSFDMRMMVTILYDDPTMSPVQCSDAFGAIFEDQIRAFGIVGGVIHRTLDAQYRERTKPVKHDHWKRIYSTTPTKEDSEKKQLLQARLDSYLSTQQISRQRTPRSSKASGKKRLLADCSNPVPLSKRPAIGIWTPETPPRKVVLLPSALTHVIRQQALPRVVQKVGIPKSPYRRRDGKIIMISAGDIPRIEVPRVTQHAAQPPLPKLLFRLWQNDPESDRDSFKGFWSRRHHNKNALSPPPRASSIDATDILDHMDRRFVDTPFISSSNRLVWMFQQTVTALKERPHDDYFVSVIDVEALDKRGVYWARPFHDEVRPSKGFSNGAGNYRGTYEWLIWQVIPQAAIIHTFGAKNLMDFASSDKEISQTLRVEVFRPRIAASLASKIATLRRQAVPLSPSVVNAMASLVHFFGLKASRNHGHISTIVAGLCEGWGLDIQARSKQDWQQLSNHFATQLGSNSFDLRERQKVKLACLDGIAWGLEDPNAKHTREGIARKEKRAKAVGLESPSNILTHELDALKLALILHEKSEQRPLQRYHQAIEPVAHLNSDDLDDEDLEIIGVHTLTDDREDYHSPERLERVKSASTNEDREAILFDTEDEDSLVG